MRSFLVDGAVELASHACAAIPEFRRTGRAGVLPAATVGLAYLNRLSSV